MTEFLYDCTQGAVGESNLYLLTEFFKSLGTPSRIRILLLLMEREFCINDLAMRLNLTQSAVSHQLNILKSNKLLQQRRDGKMMYYMLADEHVRMVLEKGIEHIIKL